MSEISLMFLVAVAIYKLWRRQTIIEIMLDNAILEVKSERRTYANNFDNPPTYRRVDIPVPPRRGGAVLQGPANLLPGGES